MKKLLMKFGKKTKGENMNLKGLMRGILDEVKKHSPEILTGLGVAGLATTVVLAVKATPKAAKILEEEEKRKGEKLTPVEAVKSTWKCYIPTAISGALTVSCIVGANSVNARRRAALAAAYSMSEKALKTYREKVTETIGEKKEQAIRDDIAKDQIRKLKCDEENVIITGFGNTLCYDSITGRTFRSDIDKIRSAEAVLNRMLYSEMYVSLNEFYYQIGLEGVSMGEYLGWNVDRGPIEFEFSSQLTEKDQPCLVINYGISPRYDFRSLQ